MSQSSEPELAPPPPSGAVPAPLGVTDPNYHCPNCLFIEAASEPGGGFWACQNLCVRD